MIKLAEIVRQIYEAKRHGGMYAYTIEFDSCHILSLCRPTDSVEVEIVINYNYYGGFIGSREEPPEPASVEFDGWDIEKITITSESGKSREIDARFLHPMARKALDVAIEKYLDKNEDDIQSKIMNGISEDDGDY